jgi:hypothetical protein
MVLINECLDNSDWSKDAKDRLKLTEIAVWYPPESGDLDTSKDTAEKTKKKKKRKSKDSKDETGEASDSETVPKRPRKDTEKDWRNSINDTLASLTSVVQQLAKSQSQVQSQNQDQNQDAPPVPPRSQEQRQLIEDVRRFVRDNPSGTPGSSTPTPSLRSEKSGKSLPDEQTVPKQRPLPKAPIPRKQAAGPSGHPRFQFAATYQDFEELDYSDREAEVEVEYHDNLPEPQQAEAKEMDLGRLEQRKMYLSGLKNMCPDLEVTKPPANKSGRFEYLDTRPKDNMMPFLTELFDHISLGSVVRDRRPRDPFTMIPKYYPTTEPAESGILQNRDIPRAVVNLVQGKKLMTQGASGRKAQLNTSIPEGMKDEYCKRSFKQASSYIRLVNNFEIDVEVMTSLSNQISSIVSDLDQLRDLPIVAKGKVLQLTQKVRLIQKAIVDVKSTNADFARASLYQYQSALYDRRNAWLSASMMLKGTKDELKSADFPRPSSQDPIGKLHMFGPEGSQILSEYDTLARDNKVPTPQNTFEGQRNSNQFNAGHFSGAYNQSYSRGQGGYRGQGQQRARGGRPNNRRPRNNYRGGRGGRGQFNPQPFSQGGRPQKKE